MTNFVLSYQAEAKHMANGTTTKNNFEKQLWAAADKLRGNMDASEYKHVVQDTKYHG